MVPLGIKSMAGETSFRAMVGVGPPLLCKPSGSSLGSVLFMEVEAGNWEILSSEML